MAQKLRPSELSFETLCNFFDAINIDNMEGWKNKFERRRQNIVLFLETSIDRKSGEAYDVFRLVFPNLDTERGNYKLKETTLGSLFVPAMGWTKNDVRANALLNWKNPGISTGAGDLSAIVEDTLTKLSFVRNDAPIQERKRIKVATINEKLDELVKAAAEVLPEERRKKQLSILTFFVKKTTPRQCKWITQIILKSMKHKCTEGQIFREWHPDAQAYYDSHGMSLRAVFNDLKDPYKPGTTDIVPGKVANPQLAATTVSSQIAIQKLISYEKKRFGPEAAGKSVKDIDLSFVIETKFDGERIQVHRTGNKVKYFSRNAIEHGARSHYTVLDDVILDATGGRVSEEDLKDEKKNGAASKFDCVLDGELIVWNKKLQAFEPFGSVKNTCNAAQRGSSPTTVIDTEDLNPYKNSSPSYLQPTLGELDLLYIPFDILYCARAARIKQPLSERQRLLKENVKATSIQMANESRICTRVEPIIPEETRFGGVIASKRASTEEEIKTAVENARLRKEEGIVVKALNSPWIPSNRGFHWLKIKPDYLHNLEIDAVILGGWYSTGTTRGCQGITQYLMGLIDAPSEEGAQPTKFRTFCRVGSGLDTEERKLVNDRLEYLLIADSSAKPSCVIAKKNGPKPDAWVRDPFKSVVLQLHADMRFIESDQFACRVSLRFPRIETIREDKSAAESNREDTFIEEMEERMKEITEAEAARVSPGGKKRKRSRKGDGQGKRKKVGLVLAHVRKQAEKIAAVEVKADILKGRKIYVFPPPPSFSSSSSSATAGVKGNLAKWRAAVKELGGVPPLNFTPSVTDVVAATLDDPKVQKFIKSNPERSILSPGWIVRCQESGMLCPLRPRDFLYLSPGDFKKLSSSDDGDDDVDKFGDSFFENVDLEDVEAFIQRHMKKENMSVEGLVRSLRAAAAPLLLLPDSHAAAAATTSHHGPSSLSNDEGDNNSSNLVFANGHTSLNKLEEYIIRAEQQQGRKFSARTVLGWLDSELAAVGKLDFRQSILHGCTLYLLDIPVLTKLSGEEGEVVKKEEEKEEEEERKNTSFLLTGTKQVEKEAAEAVVTARSLQFSRLRLAAQILGAKVVSEMSSEVTHLVGIINISSSSTAAAATENVTAETADGTTNDIDTDTTAAAVSSPDPDTLLAALKYSSPTGTETGTDGGNHAVQVLKQALLHSEIGPGSIQLVTSDWIEEAATVAAAAAITAAAAAAAAAVKEDTGTSGGGGDNDKVDVSLPQPPSAVEFPLMDAALMDDISSWPWRKYTSSSLRHPNSATAVAGGSGGGGGGGGSKGEKKQGQRQRGRGRAANTTSTDDEYKPVPGEIIHVPATRRGTAIQRGRAHRSQIQTQGINTQIKKEEEEERFDDDEIGSIADYELEDIPKVKSKPRNNNNRSRNKKKNSAAAVVKEEEEEEDGDRERNRGSEYLPPPATHNAPVPEAVPIPTPPPVDHDDDDEDDGMSFKQFFDMMPRDDKAAPLPSAAAAGAAGATAFDVHAQPATVAAIGSADVLGTCTTLPTKKSEAESLPSYAPTSMPAPSAPSASPAAAAAVEGGAGRPKLSLKERIRQMKEAKERAEAGGGKI